jgi:hypothetical protein
VPNQGAMSRTADSSRIIEHVPASPATARTQAELRALISAWAWRGDRNPESP